MNETMTTSLFLQFVALFFLVACSISAFSTVAQHLTLRLGASRQSVRLTGYTVTAIGWMLGSIVLLGKIGFNVIGVVQAVLISISVVIGLIIGAGLGTDALVGILFALDADVREGTRIELHNSLHLKGQIWEMGLFRTKILSEEGKLHILPNRILREGILSIVNKIKV
jgi:hypothetical protein